MILTLQYKDWNAEGICSNKENVYYILFWGHGFVSKQWPRWSVQRLELQDSPRVGAGLCCRAQTHSNKQHTKYWSTVTAEGWPLLCWLPSPSSWGLMIGMFSKDEAMLSEIAPLWCLGRDREHIQPPCDVFSWNCEMEVYASELRGCRWVCVILLDISVLQEPFSSLTNCILT